MHSLRIVLNKEPLQVIMKSGHITQACKPFQFPTIIELSRTPTKHVNELQPVKFTFIRVVEVLYRRLLESELSKRISACQLYAITHGHLTNLNDALRGLLAYKETDESMETE